MSLVTTSDPSSAPRRPAGVRTVEETAAGADLPFHVHPEWHEAFPWLVQGVTTAPSDMALFGDGAGGEVMERWRKLSAVLRVERMVHGRQVHEATIRVHDHGPPGLQVVFSTDGHATRARGVLLTVATADCVGITLVDPVERTVAVLHGGWRGVAGGILERGIAVMAERFGTDAGDLRLHAGPAICGRCYEVGPEVHEALGLTRPPGPTPVDLRAVVAARALEAGLAPGAVTLSGHCTKCGDATFFSHRGGCRERQITFAAVRS